MGFSRQENWSGLPFPSPVDHILSELSTMTCLSWVALQGTAHSFIELDKAVVLWSDWLVFCDFCFHSVYSLMEKDKRLMEASWWERLTEGETGSCSDGRGHQNMLSKSLIQFSVEVRAVFLPCCLTWGQTMVEVMKIIATSFRRSHAGTATLSAPSPAAGHCWPTPPPETAGLPWESPGQSLVGSLLLSPGSWCTQGFVCAL